MSTPHALPAASATASATDAEPPQGFEAELLTALPRIRGYVAALAARGPGSGPGPGPQDTEDLLQDVAAKALRYRHAHDGERSLIPWLRRIALHLVLDARRAATRRPLRLEPEAEPVAPAGTAHSERRDQLADLLARLDPLPRELLLRFHRDGESIAQIAAALQLPEGTVKSHLHRARKRLRTHPGTPSA